MTEENKPQKPDFYCYGVMVTNSPYVDKTFGRYDKSEAISILESINKQRIYDK